MATKLQSDKDARRFFFLITHLFKLDFCNFYNGYTFKGHIFEHFDIKAL